MKASKILLAYILQKKNSSAFFFFSILEIAFNATSSFSL